MRCVCQPVLCKVFQTAVPWCQQCKMHRVHVLVEIMPLLAVAKKHHHSVNAVVDWFSFSFDLVVFSIVVLVIFLASLEYVSLLFYFATLCSCSPVFLEIVSTECCLSQFRSSYSGRRSNQRCPINYTCSRGMCRSSFDLNLGVVCQIRPYQWLELLTECCEIHYVDVTLAILLRFAFTLLIVVLLFVKLIEISTLQNDVRFLMLQFTVEYVLLLP